jgi:hypothetical protein
MISHDPKYGVGQEAEMAFALYLTGRGWCVMPASTYINNTGSDIGAPIILTPKNGITVCPDLLGFHPEKAGRWWFEIKDKTEPTYYRKAHRYEHGIDAPNARDYKITQEATGSPVVIVIREKKSPVDPNLFTDTNLDPTGFSKKLRANLKINTGDFWLRISLDEALALGEHRTGNRSMVNPRNRFGEGLYWPRSAMRVIDL